MKSSKGQSKPPIPKAKKNRACLDFVKKLDDELPHARGTEGEICREAGVSLNLITNWRKGKRITLDFAWLVCRYLGLSLDYMADDDLSEKPKDPLTADERDILRMVRDLGIDLARTRLLAKPETPQVIGKEQQPTPASSKRKPAR